MKKFVLIALFMIVGCVSDKVEITTVKQWEGHYYNQTDALNAIQNMKLEKKESVWIFSNKTLETVLKNVANKESK